MNKLFYILTVLLAVLIITACGTPNTDSVSSLPPDTPTPIPPPMDAPTPTTPPDPAQADQGIGQFNTQVDEQIMMVWTEELPSDGEVAYMWVKITDDYHGDPVANPSGITINGVEFTAPDVRVVVLVFPKDVVNAKYLAEFFNDDVGEAIEPIVPPRCQWTTIWSDYEEFQREALRKGFEADFLPGGYHYIWERKGEDTWIVEYYYHCPPPSNGGTNANVDLVGGS